MLLWNIVIRKIAFRLSKTQNPTNLQWLSLRNLKGALGTVGAMLLDAAVTWSSLVMCTASYATAYALKCFFFN